MRLAWILLAVALACCSPRLTDEQASALIDQGDAALQEGRLEEAREAFDKAAEARPADPRAHFGLGLTLLRQERTAEALVSLERALELAPANPDYAYVEAHVLAKLGRSEQAIDRLSELVMEDPERIEAATELLNMLYRAGRFDEAETIVSACLEKSPSSYDLLILAGSIAAARQEQEESFDYFERARRAKPYSPTAVYGMIAALRAQDRIEESVQLMQVFEILQAGAQKVMELQREAAGSPDDPELSRRVAVAMFEGGWLKEAVDWTGDFLSRFPEHPAGGELAVRAAQAAAVAGDADSARRFLAVASRRGTRTPEETLAMADAWSRIGEFGKASDLFEKHLADHPDDPAALLGLGRALMRADQVGPAEPFLRRAVQQRPGDPEVRAALGLLLIKADSKKQAREQLERALELDASQTDALFGLGFLAHQDHDLVEAEKYLQRALELQPAHASAPVVLAMVLSEEGKCEEAIPLFVRALDMDYGNVGLHAGLVRCYEQTGRVAEAERAREDATEVLGIEP